MNSWVAQAYHASKSAKEGLRRRSKLPIVSRAGSSCYGPCDTLETMQLADIFLALGQPAFEQLVRGVSIGKLKSFQLFERVKLRFHLAKLNSETLRKASPRLWSRIEEHDEEFATDVAQVVLVSHMDMIKDVLDFLAIPNEDGFFPKDLDATDKLAEGWQQRVWDQFRGKYAEAILLFYINHLGWELLKTEQVFQPAPAPVS